MKKSLLLTAGLFAVGAQAQITINSSNYAQIGDNTLEYVDTNATGIMPGGTGMQTWDYSTLQVHDSSGYVFTNPSWTPNGSSFPTANLAADATNGQYIYLNRSSTEISLVGYYVDFTGNGAEAIVLDDPDKIVEFPSTLGTTWQDNSRLYYKTTGAAIGQPAIDSVELIQFIEKDVNVDAYGNVTIPMGTYPSVRANIQTTQYDSTRIYVTVLGGWQAYTVDTLQGQSYEFYTDDQDIRFALVTLDMDDQGNVGEARYLGSTTIVDGIEEESNNPLNVYPNPTTGIVNIDTETGNNILVLDIAGKVIANQVAINTSSQINLSSYPAGIYFVKVVGESTNKTVKVIKH